MRLQWKEVDGVYSDVSAIPDGQYIFSGMNAYNGDEKEIFFRLTREETDPEEIKSLMVRLVQQENVNGEMIYNPALPVALNADYISLPEEPKISAILKLNSGTGYVTVKPDENGMFLLASVVSGGQIVDFKIKVAAEKKVVSSYGTSKLINNLMLRIYGI